MTFEERKKAILVKNEAQSEMKKNTLKAIRQGKKITVKAIG